MWLQGRQVYTFSRLFSECDAHTLEKRAAWLETAKLGINFLPNGKGFLPGQKEGNQVIYFSTTRDGKTQTHFQRKPYASVFYTMAYLEYWRALQTAEVSSTTLVMVHVVVTMTATVM